MKTEPTQDIGDNGDSLTVSYMCGYHKRDDEVRLLKKENSKLREVAENMAEALNSCGDAPFDDGYWYDKDSVEKALQRWKDLGNKSVPIA